jgi:hypothetical protein
VFGLAVIVVPSGSLMELDELDVEDDVCAETPLANTSSNAATRASNGLRYRLRKWVVLRNDRDTLMHSAVAGAYTSRAHISVFAAIRKFVSIVRSSRDGSQ